jgi:hypothetical protein
VVCMHARWHSVMDEMNDGVLEGTWHPYTCMGLFGEQRGKHLVPVIGR